MHNQTSSSRDPEQAMQSQYHDVHQFADSPRARMPKDFTSPNQIAYSHWFFLCGKCGSGRYQGVGLSSAIRCSNCRRLPLKPTVRPPKGVCE